VSAVQTGYLTRLTLTTRFCVFSATLRIYGDGLPETEPLERHIAAIWNVVRPKVEDFKSPSRMAWL